MPEEVTCPECGKTYDTPRGFLSHWGHADDDAHSGEAPKDAYGELEFSEDHREKISEAKEGMPTKEETKRKISKTMQGMESWSKGLTKEDDERVMNRAKALEGHTRPEEANERQAESMRELWNQGAYDNRSYVGSPGEDNYFHRHGDYIGGHAEYPSEFNQQLRRQIRERDNHCCQSCGESPDDYALHVHHIDADKTNNAPTNLVSLCRPCHMTMEYKPQTVQHMTFSTGPTPDWNLTDRVVM
jgi:5-methylcytosine-specific restriction endonuclease McrA